jgi:hypothetical protein
MKLKKFVFAILFIGALLSVNSTAMAQCAMCKSNIEKARENGETQVGSTLNNGILYLLVLPYAIAGAFGFIYYKKYKEKKAAQALLSQTKQ